MKAAALAAMLSNTPTAEVRAWDPDAEGFYPVTGMTVGGDTIQLYTDSDEEQSTPSAIALKIPDYAIEAINGLHGVYCFPDDLATFWTVIGNDVPAVAAPDDKPSAIGARHSKLADCASAAVDRFFHELQDGRTALEAMQRTLQTIEDSQHE